MISYKNDICKFNFRVALIIYNEDKSKVLLQTSKGCSFSVLPGGRVEELESSYDAIKREIKEELDLSVECELNTTVEDFFNLFDMNYHEICYYFLANNIKEKDIYKKDNFLGVEGKDTFRWVDLEEFKNIEFQPKFMKDTIINKETTLKHLIVNEL